MSVANHNLIRLLDEPGSNCDALYISKYLFWVEEKYGLWEKRNFFKASGGPTLILGINGVRVKLNS